MQTVLITGSSSGIGRYTAYRFAENTDSLILTFYEDKKEIESTRNRCVELGARDVKIYQLDMSDDESITRFVSGLKDEKQDIDILINNAATIVWKPLAQHTLQEIVSQMRVNLEGTIKLTWHLLPLLKNMVINMGSRMGKFARPDLLVYCATKFGLRGFTQAFAQSNQNSLSIA